MGITISANQRRVLAELSERGDDDYAYYIATISSWTGLDYRLSRLAVRALARKGLAQLVRGLVDEYDGLLRGSGYQITPAGRALLQSESKP